jgi:hypothetical protein
MNGEPIDNGRESDGTFKPGNHASKGKGRPKGARSKATLALEALLSKNMKDIGQVLVREAKAGEPWAVALIIKTQLPVAKDPSIAFDMPKLESASDVPSAIKGVLDAIASGDITPSEGNNVILSLEAYGRSLILDGHEERLAALEAAIAKHGGEP